MNQELLHQIITLGVVALVFVIFVKDWLSPDLAAMGAFVLLVVIGVIDPKSALGIFGSSAPVTVAAMFIMSAVLERTGLIELLAGRFESLAGTSPLRTAVVLLLLVAFLSAFVNNTPVVVVFMPIVLAHCRKTGMKASGLLIPLSYAAIVGGTCTIIGTSTNLIANGIASEYVTEDGTLAMQPFGMFEVAKLGIIFVIGTLLYLILGGAKLIPNRTTLSTLFDATEGHEYLTQAYVTPDSPLVGKLFTESPLSKNRNLRIVEIVREGRPYPVALNKLKFEVGDLVIMKTRASGVMEISEITGLDLTPKGELGLDHIRTESAVLMEGIVGPGSKLIGHTLRELNFRQRFGVVIIAVHRRGVNLRSRFEDVKLAFGDTLRVEGPRERMSKLFEEKDFVNLS
ncbi:MAG: SLC13 family permease, partial [Verrucomicrobiales bacterium]|nr:SLC13 family permease [Verrucomicrobiales bacterium]